jgi:hypothetical protein
MFAVSFPKNDINYNIREEFNLIEYFSSNNQPIFEPELKFLELEELVRTQHKRLEYHAILYLEQTNINF